MQLDLLEAIAPSVETKLGVVVHVNRAPYDIYIGRANSRAGLPQSKWHNPYVIGKDGDRDTVLAKFERRLLQNDELMAAIEELRGKRLGCWCCKTKEGLTADDPLQCHGQILLKALRGDYAIASSTEESDRIPETYTARTLIDSQRFILADFNPEHFCDVDAADEPFLSQHDIYTNGVYVGIIFRYSVSLPWMIQARGELNSKVHGESFEDAVQALIQWRKSLDAADRELFKSWRVK